MTPYELKGNFALTVYDTKQLDEKPIIEAYLLFPCELFVVLSTPVEVEVIRSKKSSWMNDSVEWAVQIMLMKTERIGWINPYESREEIEVPFIEVDPCSDD